MPPLLYDCKTRTVFKTKQDQKIELKIRDNINQKIRYWRKIYKYDLTVDDYNDFNKNVKIIRKIYKIHEFMVNESYKKQSINSIDLDIRLLII